MPCDAASRRGPNPSRTVHGPTLGKVLPYVGPPPPKRRHCKFLCQPGKETLQLKETLCTKEEDKSNTVHAHHVCVVCLCPDRDSLLFCCCRSQWERMTVRREMGFFRRRGRVTCRVRCENGSLWQKRSPSMVARNGTVVFAQRRKFGHGRSVGGARRAFRLCCKVKTCKQHRRRMVADGLSCRLQAMERIK